MKKIHITPVVLCGGSGTRLWPLSSECFPKQFLSLTGKESLFQKMAQRLVALGTDDIDFAKLLVVTGESYRFLAAEQLREVGIEFGDILLEPVSRNTAPALAIAALAAQADGRDPVLVVAPADQTISDSKIYAHAIRTAIYEAASGAIVILGVKPDRPETGYGYIQTEADSNEAVKYVRRFVEKPNADNAQQYLLEGNYFWNSGIFVLRASVWLKALNQFRPDILISVEAAWVNRNADGKFVRLIESDFEAVPSDSVDYAVLERCPGSNFPTKMVPLEAGWSDLGSWDAIWRMLSRDENGNARRGDVISTGSKNTLVWASSRLVTLVGTENVVVVETPDAVLVADMSRSQEVAGIFNRVKKVYPERGVLGHRVTRPWGWYVCIEEGSRFKVKRIHVNPNSSLSLQKHRHRAEHWTVVAGVAEVTNGDERLLLGENQSTYIPRGAVHRLSNKGNIPVEVIEVQSGSYLGEDDIIRIEDDYGRVT
jgi:mannose-1-phosphate guanylyltransferase/mannose-6-phosphate isomerase